MRHLLRTSVFFLVTFSLVAVAAVLAQQDARDGEAGHEDSSTPPEQAASEEIALPSCLNAVELTSEQQEKIREIVRDYDSDVAAVWKQFSKDYMRAIRTEALLLCAIEDNLTDAQREQVRAQRRKVAQHEEFGGTKAAPPQATDRPENAVAEELAIVGVSLSPEQELAADKIHGQYVSHLRGLNRDIEGLHRRLVSLEAGKLAQIEEVLTKEQLERLRESRQTAPSTASNPAASRQTAPLRRANN